MTESRLKTLVLSLDYAHTASYFDDWRQALAASDLFRSQHENILKLSPASLAQTIDEHDAVVLLHSCAGDTIEHLAPLAGALEQRKRARLLAFIGNEFNSPHCPLGTKIDVLKRARVDIVATQLPKEAGAYLYGDFATVAALPHALNERVFTPGPALGARPIDIGFRGFRYNALIGDDERDRLIGHFEDNAAGLGLTIDIDWHQRFDSTSWAAYLRRCAGTISAEAGSWYLDRGDALVTRIYQSVQAGRSGMVLPDHGILRSAFRRLPQPVKQAAAQILRKGPVKFAGFEDEKLDLATLKRDFFDAAQKCPAYSKCISSRHFDAAGAKTCQILLEGRYNGILSPGEHYIEVRRDHSNLAEAIALFKDVSHRQAVADRAFDYLMDNHRYENRMGELYAAFAALS